MEGAHPAFTLVVALAAGVIAQSIARHLRIPGIVLLLATGLLLGPGGVGWVQPRDLGAGLIALVELSVAVILFEGGLNLQLSRLRREQAAIRRLLSIGALVTLVGGMLAVRMILGVDWVAALLFGSLVVVTGPTVIQPLVAELRLKPRVATVLRAEGVLIDPIGAILAVLVLELLLAPNADGLGRGAVDLVLRLGFGALAGGLVGLLIGRLLRLRRLVPEGHQNIMVLVLVLLLFEGCEQVVSTSGLLAVTIAGVVVGNLSTPLGRDLREFKDQLTVLLVGMLFVVLAADIRYSQLQTLGWSGVSVVAVLIFFVRPLGVALSTMGSDLSVRERMFVAWLAPRGIVAAAVASVVATELESRGIPGGLELRALVFLTIAGTVVVAGLTARPVASLLGVRLPGRDGVAILGANGLGLLLGEQLRESGKPVIFLDSNPQSCRRAEEGGFAVVFGNALEERTMQRARFETIEVAVGLTANQTLNGVYTSRARELFQVPRSLIAAERLEAGLVGELSDRQEVEGIFEGPHDLERWDVRSRHGDVAIEHCVFEPVELDETGDAGDGSQSRVSSAQERFVILTLSRGGATRPMARGLEPQAGDVAAVAIHTPERAEAETDLAALGWHSQPEAKASQAS